MICDKCGKNVELTTITLDDTMTKVVKKVYKCDCGNVMVDVYDQELSDIEKLFLKNSIKRLGEECESELELHKLKKLLFKTFNLTEDNYMVELEKMKNKLNLKD